MHAGNQYESQSGCQNDDLESTFGILESRRNQSKSSDFVNSPNRKVRTFTEVTAGIPVQHSENNDHKPKRDLEGIALGQVPWHMRVRLPQSLMRSRMATAECGAALTDMLSLAVSGWC
jgi:hypothetical protein